MSGGDSCWLERRGSGERGTVTGDNMMMMIIILMMMMMMMIIIIISPKFDIVSLYVIKERRCL